MVCASDECRRFGCSLLPLKRKCLVVVQLLSHLWLFVTPRTAAHKLSLSFTISQSLLKLTSIELVMPSNRFILVTPFSSCPQSSPASGSFPMSWLFQSVAKALELQLQHQSFQWTFRVDSFRTDWFDLLTKWMRYGVETIAKVSSKFDKDKYNIVTKISETS